MSNNRSAGQNRIISLFQAISITFCFIICRLDHNIFNLPLTAQYDVQTGAQEPALLHPHDAVTRILANGGAAFIEICAAIGRNSCDSVSSPCWYRTLIVAVFLNICGLRQWWRQLLFSRSITYENMSLQNARFSIILVLHCLQTLLYLWYAYALPTDTHFTNRDWPIQHWV